MGEAGQDKVRSAVVQWVGRIPPMMLSLLKAVRGLSPVLICRSVPWAVVGDDQYFGMQAIVAPGMPQCTFPGFQVPLLINQLEREGSTAGWAGHQSPQAGMKPWSSG